MSVGNALKFMMTNPLGEEITEGTVGGLLYGGGMLGSDMPLDEALVSTAGAIGGGIALGMGGRRIGAFAGRRINPNALKDQKGVLASMARIGGSETTAKGLSGQASIAKGAIEESLINETSSRMLREAVDNPTEFATKYGIDPAIFEQNINNVATGRKGAQLLKVVESMPPEQRKEVLNAAIKDYEKVENVLVKEAAGSINQTVDKASKILDDPEAAALMAEQGINASELQKAAANLIQNKAESVTGEHVGRAIGRFAGDEIGILTGGLLAGQLYNSES